MPAGRAALVESCHNPKENLKPSAHCMCSLSQNLVSRQGYFFVAPLECGSKRLVICLRQTVDAKGQKTAMTWEALSAICSIIAAAILTVGSIVAVI